MMLEKGTIVRDPTSKSVGVVQRVAERAGPDCYEVKVTVAAAKSNHRDKDIVIWEIK